MGSKEGATAGGRAQAAAAARRSPSAFVRAGGVRNGWSERSRCL